MIIRTIDPGLHRVAIGTYKIHDGKIVCLGLEEIRNDDKLKAPNQALPILKSVATYCTRDYKFDAVLIEAPHESFACDLNKVSGASAVHYIHLDAPVTFINPSSWTSCVAKEDRLPQLEIVAGEALKTIQDSDYSKMSIANFIDTLGMAVWYGLGYKYKRPKKDTKCVTKKTKTKPVSRKR